jgi:uncharacterized protein involved in type VI secretion and phage assembly
MREEDTHISIYDGIVHDNADPLRIGRVRVIVPGMIEPYSAWALPCGNSGGGSSERGFWCVPAIGSNVSVLFKEGDPDHPRYFAGPWGAPNDQPESPTFAGSLSPADAVEVSGLQTKRWDIVCDDRPGQEKLIIRDRLMEQNTLEIDGVAQAVTLSGTVAVQIKSTGVVNIQALQIILNGRVVLPAGGPI